MQLNEPRPCVNLCGATVEWSFDRHRRVGLIESSSRAAHVCPRGLTGAHLNCACGRRIHTYRHGYVEDAETGLPHECYGARQAAPPRARTEVTPPPPASARTTQSAPEPPRRSLNDALGVG